MYGVESPTNAAGMVRALPERTLAPPPPKTDEVEEYSARDSSAGPLSAARNSVRAVLASLGFIDFTASQQEILRMQFQQNSAKAESEELNAEVTPELTSLAAGQIVSDSTQALRAQARIGPEKAARLLT